MKFYQSPLSIVAILFLVWGLWMLMAMFKGAYPTYLAFIYPIFGILLFVMDYFIRKSDFELKIKLLIQIISIMVIVAIGYLLFKG